MKVLVNNQSNLYERENGKGREDTRESRDKTSKEMV